MLNDDLAYTRGHNIAYSDVDEKPEVLGISLERMVGASGFEPPASWSRTSSRNTILLARLALFCVEQVRLGWYSAVNGLKSDPSPRKLGP